MSDKTMKKGPWSTEEQIALLVSIIENLGGIPNFNNMALPVGRSIHSCSEQYIHTKNDISSVPMTAAPAPPVTKKRAKTIEEEAVEGETDETGAESTPPTKRRKRTAPMDDSGCSEAVTSAHRPQRSKVEIEEVQDEEFGGKRAG